MLFRGGRRDEVEEALAAAMEVPEAVGEGVEVDIVSNALPEYVDSSKLMYSRLDCS